MESKDKEPEADKTVSSDASASDKRRSRWDSCKAGVDHILRSYKSEEVKTRQKDKVSTYLLLAAVATGLISVIAPSLQSSMLLAYDLILGITIVFYVIQRFGIINALSSREAVLCAELLLVMVILGGYLTMNVLTLCGAFVFK